jgi:hypothetical protein
MAVKRIVPKFIISSRPSSGASPPAVAFVGSIGWCPAWTRLRGEQARSCWQLGNSSSRSRLSPYPSSPVQRRTGILCRLQHQPYRACPQPWNHIINGITTYLSSCLSRGLPATAEERGSHTATCCHYCFSGFERCKLLRKRQPAAWPIAARNAVSLSTATRLPSPATSCNSHPEPIRQTRLYLQLDRYKILYRRQCLPWRALPMGNGKEASRVP